MKYTTYGKTEKEVSVLGMGGMRFNKEIPESECVSAIRYANELGITYFDTAPLYNEDRSEDIYGQAFSEMQRDKYTIASKCANNKTAKEAEKSIETSLRRLKVDKIDFYFLWCIIYPEQYKKAKMKGQALEAIIKAKERGLIEHIGVSTHTYSDGIKMLVDDEIFDFIMIPYNALNYAAREEGLRYAKKKNIGTAVMNPIYGGVIAEFKDKIKIYPDSTKSPIEDALRFCMDSPYIDVTLSGMNSKKIIEENVKYASESKKLSEAENEKKQQKIKASFSDMCTSCGYCLKHCPEKINIKSYMEIFNTYKLSDSIKITKGRHNWYTKFGPLQQAEKKADNCTQCKACESECTQYLNITERLEWISKEFESE